MFTNITPRAKLTPRPQHALSNRAQSLTDSKFLKTNEYDSWLVLSPGRTGSKVIVDIVRHFYGYNRMDLDYDDPVMCERGESEVGPLKIIHSHQVTDYEKFIYFTPHVVISTRDMVESAISYVIQKRIKKWHSYSIEQARVDFELFELDLDEFYAHYDDIINFYRDLKKALTKYKPRKNFHVIDYTEFKNNSTDVYKLLNFENINEVYSSQLEGKVPVKNLGMPHDWISNWYSSQYILARLKRKPELF